MTDLIGRWFIQQTTFPMWLNGKRRHPTLNYHEHNDQARMGDIVKYVNRAGKQKQICGYDRQDPEISAHFTWRGKGLLALLKSDWYVAYQNQEDGVVAIYFTKTIVTPEGIDIISREQTICFDALQEARNALAQFKILRPILLNLSDLPG